MLAAARSFLDVVEDVVEDPERLSAAASSVVDLVRGGVASATRPTSPLQPWEQAAWGAEGSPVDLTDDVELSDDDRGEDPGDDVEPVGQEELSDQAIDLDALDEVDDEPLGAPGDVAVEDVPVTPRRRVRRIAVD